MGWETDIAAGIETALKASADSDIKNGNIYSREELPADEIPDPVSIYIEPLLPRPDQVSDATIFKIYPFAIRLVFCEAARAVDETEVDVVSQRKSQYQDALFTVILTCNPWSTNPISAAVFQVDFIRRVNSELTAEIIQADEKRGSKSYRIEQLWEFRVNES